MSNSLLGTTVFVAEEVPSLPSKILFNRKNGAAVAANEAARIAAWVAFDTPGKFTEVQGVITVGDVGGTFTINTTTLLANGLEDSSKGSVNPGSGTFEWLYNMNDPGQNIVRKFGMATVPCSFKFVYADGEIKYFTGLVGGDVIGGGDANTNKAQSAELSLKDFVETIKPIAVTGVTLDQTTLSVLVDDTEDLVATVTPSNASNNAVMWSSGDPAIATVSTDGSVTGVSVGGTTITVTTVDGGFTAACAVTVA